METVLGWTTKSVFWTYFQNLLPLCGALYMSYISIRRKVHDKGREREREKERGGDALNLLLQILYQYDELHIYNVMNFFHSQLDSSGS